MGAAAIGTGFSVALNMFIASIFMPAMTAEFGWTSSEISFVGTLGLIGMLTFPLAGRLADVFGSRRVMMFGVIALPSIYFLYSLQTGPIWQFWAIQAIWAIFSPLWSATVLGRIAAGRLVLARGFGIALLLSAPAITGAIAAPLLGGHIEAEGWRSAYRVLAAVVFVAGVVAVLLLPGQGDRQATRTDTRPTAQAFQDIFRSRAFIILAAAMVLCNLGIIATGLQFASMLIERGVNPRAVGSYLSAYAVGVIIGRFAIGLSLDRFPTRYVAAIGMGMPAIGFALLAALPGASEVAFAAVLLLGLSQGAEGDIGGYVGAQYLGPQLFGTIFGLVTAFTNFAGFIGALVAGWLMYGSSSFGPFLAFLACTTALGSATFLLLPKAPSLRAA
ncbi:MFS transporter [Sandaracinobacteroides saxicola]|uniref:MFS transporter n=1 Tax=Sandaracinobacteroides saxicola TaxID=2759707 RepID=A0A7G5IIS4_9SPHN|nr:MFS transporter [Sandaracinobacteroides saxicola]QMW23266.1 MFS transporter [Sandaracinobacteroides saxicola]